ncbi:MAG: hypothetical protein UZ13_02006, partial [Chloroflexi bacterium OLB13]
MTSNLYNPFSDIENVEIQMDYESLRYGA